MKICLVGFGHAGKSYLMALAALNQKKQVFVVDIDCQVKNLLPKDIQFSIEIPKTHFDLAIIATPPKTHLQVYKDIKNFSSTVIIEKPFSNNLLELQEFIDLATYNNIYFSIHATHGEELDYYCDDDRESCTQISQLFCDPYGVDTPVNLGGAFWDSIFNALGIVNKIINVEHLEVVQVVENNTYYFEMECILRSDQNTINYKLVIDWQKKINFKITEISTANRSSGLIYNHSQQCISDLNGLDLKYKSLEHPRLVSHYKSVIEDCLNLKSFDSNNYFARKVIDQVKTVIEFVNINL